MPQTQTKEFLSNHPLFRTGDLDEARHCVTQKFCDHKLFLSSKGDQLSVHHNHVAGKHVSVNYLRYGANVQINPGMLERFYLLQIPLSGHALVRHRGKDIVANRKTATLLNPDRETDMIWSKGCRKLLLQVDKAFLRSKAEEVLGVPIPGDVRFDPVVDLTKEGGQIIRKMVINMAVLAEVGTLFGEQSAVQDLWAESELVTKLLTLQNSNISHILAKSNHLLLPVGIKLALSFIHANMAEPIHLADIAQYSSINIRTLQKGFKRAFGITPMQVLHNARLDAAYYQLAVRQNKPSVTDVAFSNGFSHLGRFSRDYKNRFGSLPSQVNLKHLQ